MRPSSRPRHTKSASITLPLPAAPMAPSPHSSLRSSLRPRPSSPSRLPSTDSLSYFPPFEAMGSVCSDQAAGADGEGSSTGTSHREKKREAWQGHARGEAQGSSLGSIKDMVSAGISWSLSGFACTAPPTPADIAVTEEKRPRHTHSSSTSKIPSKPQPVAPRLPHANSCAAVEALARRINPAKRRVLEPLTLDESEHHLSVSTRSLGGWAGPRGEESVRDIHKRRMKGEVEAVGLARSESQGDVAFARKPSTLCRSKSLHNPTTRRPPRLRLQNQPKVSIPVQSQQPTLQVPLPTPYHWRFPLPSPPVTSLSPDIPHEAFEMAVDNPCSPRSPRGPRSSLPAFSVSARGELEQVEYDLSPSVSPTITSSSQPSTPPPPKRDLGYALITHSSTRPDPWSHLALGGGPVITGGAGKVRRMRSKSSGWSEKSGDTIRPGVVKIRGRAVGLWAEDDEGDGEATPKGKVH
ncbi:hypothetical protein L198_04215 [Cryptococcus wingfieldii CBS 7118]|uniref:Uncharacterized protein n=1 Tax=Cryptococcus wingfieldii CBS 7118 TaxID=1295528 RepID=A0A1E3J989_9TREE|nr:hypothetical protein L198_04215 [Cryptococcus wingfieldii CBS 7118]ODN96501.1 hypothetical protein L198_04215 [Cryptococcus wingfieldii CBS 7118]